MADDIESLQRQLSEAQENLRLIEERMAQYVQEVDIPIQLVKDKRRLEENIAGLQTLLEQATVPSPPRPGAAAERQPVAARPATQPKPLWMWVVGIVLVLVVLGGGSFLGIQAARRSWTMPTEMPQLTSTVAMTPTSVPAIVAVPTSTHTPVAAHTLTPTPTSIPLPTSTPTRLPTSTPVPTPTPTLLPEAGTTRIRDKDGAVMVYVPAGEFWMGSTDEDIDAVLAECGSCIRESFTDEQPQHKVSVDAYWIDRTEVTNARYKQCVDEGGCEPPKEVGYDTRPSYYGNPEFAEYPVVNVNWYQARAYAEWVGGRLPTEAEWEYAARGAGGGIYPWGDDPPHASLLNSDWSAGDTTQVGSYPDGASWCGALDMSGNVSEWTQSLYKDYPYDAADGRGDLGADGARVVRGGAFHDSSWDVRCASRKWYFPDDWYWKPGFRVVVDPG